MLNLPTERDSATERASLARLEAKPKPRPQFVPLPPALHFPNFEVAPAFTLCCYAPHHPTPRALSMAPALSKRSSKRPSPLPCDCRLPA